MITLCGSIAGHVNDMGIPNSGIEIESSKTSILKGSAALVKTLTLSTMLCKIDARKCKLIFDLVHDRLNMAPANHKWGTFQCTLLGLPFAYHCTQHGNVM